MAETTGIEWADATHNFWYGCKKVSPGCKNCYAERDMEKYGRNFGVVTRSKNFDAPRKWARNKKLSPDSRIFTCSWSDFFIAEADEWRTEAWHIIRQTPYIYMILTKRPERIQQCLPNDWGRDGYPNVWLGVSAENQAMADKRIPVLVTIPARVRFVSAEPLLGPIDLERVPVPPAMDPVGQVLHWVITGGESDRTNPRKCNLDWVRFIRDQCTRNHVSFFHKQHGGTKKIDGAWGGRVLDGVIYNEFPWQTLSSPYGYIASEG